MNFLHKSIGKDEMINSKNNRLKTSLTQEFLKKSPSNNKIKNMNKENNASASSNLNKNYINQQKNKNFDINKYLLTYENEENEEEEEINSDEYVSSTNLEVETNTYINMSNSNKNNEEKIMTDFNNKKMTNSLGRIRTKVINYNLENKNEVIGSGVGNIFLNNNETKFIKYNDNDNDKELNLYKSNDNNINYYKKINEDNAKIYDRTHSRKNEKALESYYKEKMGVFTPDNEGQKTLRYLREMMSKKIDNLQNKNVKNTPQSHTINMLESKSNNNFKPINNRLIKKGINLDLHRHQRNKTMKITINNSINNNVSNDYKNISMNEIYKNINSNNKMNSLYNNNNITKDGININDQKYQAIPQKIKKIKTQGRVGKIIYKKKNDNNNFISFNNSKSNNNNINKTINTPLTVNHSKNMNRISPINHSNNMNKYNSICANKQNNNFHSLKNIKIDNTQKNIKKYIFDDDYLAMLPFNQDKNKTENNEKQQQQKNNIKSKDSNNIKNFKNQSYKHYQSINNALNSLYINDYKYEKIIPKNIKAQKQQIRSINSCLPKRVNQNMINPITNQQILTTISNNPRYNKKLDTFKRDFTNISQIQNQNEHRNTSDNKYKNRELSFSLGHENSIKNIILYKKMRKNKNFKSTDFNNMEINNNNNNSKMRKSKPLTTRINIDLMNEDNKNNIKRFNTNVKDSIMNSNNETLKTTINSNKNNNYAQVKKIYLDKNNYKRIPYKCLSPNYQSIKHLIEDKNNISKIRQMYSNKLGLNERGRNSYNIYFSSSMNENNSSNYGNNSNNFPLNNNITSNNITLLKKIQKDNSKNRYPIQTSNTVNYNIGNLSNFSGQNKKIIVFNNVNNYNINNTSNTLNNITDIKNNPNNKYAHHQANDDIKHFSSLINKSMGRNPKKIVINKILTYHPNNKMISGENKNNFDLRGNNIINLDNQNVKKYNTFMKINNINKNQYNNNAIYKYNNINNNNHINLNDNNQFMKFSISNDKERNTVNNNNSCVNLYLNKGINKNKENNTIEIFNKISDNYFKKSISPNQEIKNKY